MLLINDLYVEIEKKEILKKVNLHIKPGEVHAIMGPNGSGKSTLAHALIGHENYKVNRGTINFHGENLLKLSSEERALSGLFLAFQYPTEIPGVNNTYFLKTALNSIRKKKMLPEIDSFDFISMMKEKMELIKLDKRFMDREVNRGFSGGEKKCNEVLQMLMLEPKCCILDEIDSGLDIDTLKIVAKGINYLRSSKRSIIIITHYQRLLNYIVPDFVHIFSKGNIACSGDKYLAIELEKQGYDKIIKG